MSPQRFKEMKSIQNGVGGGERKRKAELREQREIARMTQMYIPPLSHEDSLVQLGHFRGLETYYVEHSHNCPTHTFICSTYITN